MEVGGTQKSCPKAWGGFIKHSALRRQWHSALSGLRGMHLQGLEPNAVAWNLVAAASGRCQKWQTTLRLLRSADAADEITYNTAAKTSCQVALWETGCRCINIASDRRLKPDTVSHNILLNGSGKAGSWRICLHEFATREIDRDATASTSALSALRSELLWQAGVQLLSEFFRQALQADTALLGTGIGAGAAGDRWHSSLNLFSRLQSLSLRMDSVCLGACANGFVQHANWRQAVHLGVLLTREDLHLSHVFCNSILGAFQKCGRWESVGATLRALCRVACSPDLIAMNTAVAACDKGSSWQRATLLLGETAALDLQPDAILKSAVLTARRDAADWQMQLQHFWTAFCGCHTPSLALCNAVLDVLTTWQPALHVLGRLGLWRLRPSHVTCGASVQSHSTSGRWRESQMLLNSFLSDRSWGSTGNLKSSQAWCSVVQVPGIPWQAALDILCKVREDRLQEDATLLATVTGANAKRASCPNTPIPKTGKYVKPHLKEVYKFFRDEWVNCNVFRSPGPMQLDSSGDVGPLSERPITLLADYFSVDELKQIVQPRAQPAPLVMCKEPLVVRDVRLRENLSLLEQERLNYEPALPGYLRDRVTWQEDELAPHSCDNIEELVQSFPLIHSHVCAIRLVPPIAAEGDEVETLMSERSPTSTMRQTAAASDCGKPMTVGIVFASSQVPGYHPVIAGLFDYLDGLPGPAKLIGFFCGYEGLLKDLWAPITKDMVDQFRNLGGTGSAWEVVVGSWAAEHALSMPMAHASVFDLA
ncbi:unnamed protein product [Symbiodinium sp. CCMP2592]|nr:unnamed protein product [Symbiodinium sp. CCMP2592]